MITDNKNSNQVEGTDAEPDSGYAGVAKWLSETTDQRVIRQSVWQWWDRRDRTGFPDGHLEPLSSGRHHRVFSHDEVMRWWETYRQRSRYQNGNSSLHLQL